MRLKIGSAIRPNRECVAVPSYQPTYDVLRRVVTLTERWEITGRLAPETDGYAAMNVALEKLQRDFSQENVTLVFLEEDRNRETFFKLDVADCLQGPYIVESSFPNRKNDVYSVANAYRVVFEAVVYVGRGRSLLEFEETINFEPGGREFVYVGGAVNDPERQLGMQKKTWRYVQAGRALGLLAYPEPPPPIWPHALVNPDGYAGVKKNPRALGTAYGQDTGFEASWEYVFEWHQKLNGNPHRLYP